jgi:hypothetical protein
MMWVWSQVFFICVASFVHSSRAVVDVSWESALAQLVGIFSLKLVDGRALGASRRCIQRMDIFESARSRRVGSSQLKLAILWVMSRENRQRAEDSHSVPLEAANQKWLYQRAELGSWASMGAKKGVSVTTRFAVLWSHSGATNPGGSLATKPIGSRVSLLHGAC